MADRQKTPLELLLGRPEDGGDETLFGSLGGFVQENVNPYGIFGESKGDKKERQAGFRQSGENLDALRDRIPGTQTAQEFYNSPQNQELLRRVMNGEITSEEAQALQAPLLANATGAPVEYGTVDPKALDYVSDDLQGYEATLMDGTAFDSLQGQDEREGYAGTQQSALDRVLGIANEGGLTAIDRARIAEQRAGEEQWLRGQRGATLANMEARGMGGSGAELASIFDSQQSSANRNAMSGTQIEALAQQRQDQALRDSFGMSSDARRQSFGEASDIATAQDRTNQWNSQLGTDQARYLSDVMNQGTIMDSGTRNANTYDTRDQGDRGKDATREAERWRYMQDANITGAENNVAVGLADSNVGVTERANQGMDRIITGAATAGFGELGVGQPNPTSGGTKLPTYQPPQSSGLIDPWADPEDDD
jgi:hypothetical protein